MTYFLKKGVSATTNALSQYINSLTGNKIKIALMESMPLNIASLAPYPDFLAFFLSILIICNLKKKNKKREEKIKKFIFKVLLLIGVKESTFLNKLFTVLNIFIILLIAICGSTKADFNNWKIMPIVRYFLFLFFDLKLFYLLCKR